MLNIGKYVGNHGIKGEIKLISNFSNKDLIFKQGFKIYIDNKEFIIKSYRPHKNYDMLFLEGINQIDDIIELSGKDVYIKREDIESDFLDEDLKYYKVIINGNSYELKDILNNSNQKLILLSNDKMIPFAKDFITNIDNINKIIYMNIPDGLL